MPSAQNSLQNICRQHLRDRRAASRGTSPAIYVFRDGDGKAESKQNKRALHSVHLYNTQSFRCIALLSFDRHRSMLCAAAGASESKRFVLATKIYTKQNTSGYRFIIDTGHPTTRCLVDRRTPSQQRGVASGAFVNHISVLCHSSLVMCRLWWHEQANGG